MMLLIFMYLQKYPTKLYIVLLKWWNKPTLLATSPQLSWKSYLNKKVIDIKKNKIITYDFVKYDGEMEMEKLM